MAFKRIFRRVIINGEVIAGEDIEDVIPPVSEMLTWRIALKNGATIAATGNISVWTVLK